MYYANSNFIRTLNNLRLLLLRRKTGIRDKHRAKAPCVLKDIVMEGIWATISREQFEYIIPGSTKLTILWREGSCSIVHRIRSKTIHGTLAKIPSNLAIISCRISTVSMVVPFRSPKLASNVSGMKVKFERVPGKRDASNPSSDEPRTISTPSFPFSIATDPARAVNGDCRPIPRKDLLPGAYWIRRPFDVPLRWIEYSVASLEQNVSNQCDSGGGVAHQLSGFSHRQRNVKVAWGIPKYRRCIRNKRDSNHIYYEKERTYQGQPHMSSLWGRHKRYAIVCYRLLGRINGLETRSTRRHKIFLRRRKYWAYVTWGSQIHTYR